MSFFNISRPFFFLLLHIFLFSFISSFKDPVSNDDYKPFNIKYDFSFFKLSNKKVSTLIQTELNQLSDYLFSLLHFSRLTYDFNMDNNRKRSSCLQERVIMMEKSKPLNQTVKTLIIFPEIKVESNFQGGLEMTTRTCQVMEDRPFFCKLYIQFNETFLEDFSNNDNEEEEDNYLITNKYYKNWNLEYFRWEFIRTIVTFLGFSERLLGARGIVNNINELPYYTLHYFNFYPSYKKFASLIGYSSIKTDIPKYSVINPFGEWQ